jgi:hypothetical protein
MTAPRDPVRAFNDALTPPARRHLDRSGGLTPDAVRWIHAATQHIDPAELARIASHLITPRLTHAAARRLILHRLQREAERAQHSDSREP